MSTARISPLSDRAAWLAERQNGIGASEAASAIGVPDAYESPLQVYLRKIGVIQPAEPTERMTWGSKLEPLIAEAYEEKSGNKIVETQVFRRDGHLFATLDAVDDTSTIVEFKTISDYQASKVLGEEESNEVPYSWIVQAHQQMAVSNATGGMSFRSDCVTFAVLIGGQRLAIYGVPWNDRLWAGVRPRLDRFWEQVQTRTPPAVLVPDDAQALAKLYHETIGFTVLGNEAATLVDRWDELGKTINAAQKERDLVRAQILEIMRDAGIGVLPDGRKLRRSVSLVKEHTVKAFQTIRLTLSKGR